MSRAPLSTRKKLVFGIIIVVVPCVLLLLLAEGAVRLRAKLKYGFVWGVEDTFAVDQDLGLRVLKPNTELGNIKINSRGFRSPEIEVPKPAGTIRVGFLGASTTYCAEVSSNQATWPHLVVTQLREAFPGVRFDYINAGVPGYGVGSSLKMLNSRVAELEPDVLLIYHATNDLSGISRNLARTQGVIAPSPKKRSLWLSQHSLLVHLVEKNLRILMAQSSATAADNPAEDSDRTVAKLEFDPEALRTPFDEGLDALVKGARAAAPMVAIATFSARIRASQTKEEKSEAAVTSLYYMPYMTLDNLVAGFDLYNQVIREVASRNGATLIDGEQEIPGDAVHFNDSVHFTDAGSTVMARRVSSRLSKSEPFRSLVAKVQAAASDTNSPLLAMAAR